MGISMEYQWNINGISMEYQWNINGISMEYQWNINGISMEYQWNIIGISMEYQWNIMGMSWSKVFHRNTLGNRGTDLKPHEWNFQFRHDDLMKPLNLRRICGCVRLTFHHKALGWKMRPIIRSKLCGPLCVSPLSTFEAKYHYIYKYIMSYNPIYCEWINTKIYIYHVRDAHPDVIPDMNIPISFPILYVLKHQTILVWTATRTAVTGEPVRFDPSVSIASCAPDDVAFEWIRRTSNHKDTLGTVKIAVGGLNEVWQNSW